MISYLYLLLFTEIILLILTMLITSFDFVSPGFITIFMFILSTICVIWNEDYWNVRFTQQTYNIVTLGLAVIVVVELFIKNILSQQRKNVWIDQKEFARREGYRINIGTQATMALIFTIMMIIYVSAVVRAGGSSSLLNNIGVVHTDVEIDVGIVGSICIRVLRLGAFPFLFFFINNVVCCKKKILNNILLLVPVLDAMIAIFFSGVRSTFMYYIIAVLFYIVMLQRFRYGWKEIKWRKYIKHIIIFGGLFIVFFVGSRSIVKNHGFTSTGMEYITFYLGSPLHLFNKIVNNTTLAFPTHYSNIPGAHTFKWFYQEIYKFGLIDTYVEDTRFVAVGGGYYGGGNVYTIFATPYHDFGLFGMLIYVALFYAVFNYIYYKKFKYNQKVSNSLESLMLFGSYYYFVFMSFYGTMTAQLKLQTILEMAVIIVIFRLLYTVKIKLR